MRCLAILMYLYSHQPRTEVRRLRRQGSSTSSRQAARQQATTAQLTAQVIGTRSQDVTGGVRRHLESRTRGVRRQAGVSPRTLCYHIWRAVRRPPSCLTQTRQHGTISQGEYRTIDSSEDIRLKQHIKFP